MKTIKLSLQQKETRRRIIELTYQLKMSHLGSCLSAVDIIDAVYQTKTKEERFVLSGGHAGIALYVILEKYGIITPDVTKTLHIHPDRNTDLGIDVSSGSLGQGLPIALGMALADRQKRIFCLVTDGECAEGSIWESLRIMYENKVHNLITIVNANGWRAYDPVSLPRLASQIKGFGFNVLKTNGLKPDQVLSAIDSVEKKSPAVIFAKTSVEQFPFLKGLDAHYYVMNDKDYKMAMEMLQ